MTDEDADRTQPGKPISFRAPASLAKLIEEAAERELLSTSAYCRRAVLRSVEALEARPCA